MLAEAVHLFQSRGFVTSADAGADAERTAAALKRALRCMRAEALV